MARNLKRLLLLLIVTAGTAFEAAATHLRAGEITVTRVSCSSHTYKITITVYIDTEFGVKFGGPGEILHFGDGNGPYSWVEVPETETIPRPDLGPNMGIATFTVEHTYAGNGFYTIKYTEPNRNEGVLNIFDSVNTTFYLETTFMIDAFLGCNETPRLLVPPIDKACTGVAWFHNPGAYDPDGDSISFEMTIPKRDEGQFVTDYRDPNEREFYDKIGLDYETANEADNDRPTFTIDPRTGTIVWDAPGAPGEYNIAFLIKEWRKQNGTWIPLGYVTRDMQIVVEDCLNQRPELEVPEDICVEAGEEIEQQIFGYDPDSDDVKIDAYSQVFEINPSPAIMIPNPSEFQASSPANKAVVTFLWKTDCAHVRDQPYEVIFKITDKPASGAPLVHFETWFIKVVAPAPKWEDAQVDLGSRSAVLKWENYVCSNADTMQVWRRIDQLTYTPPECVTGIPEFLGFTKIAELPINQSQFTDNNGGKGLAAGAQYCYRLVAVFPLPGGGESYVSKDTCLAPILADAPVITNVTIDKTGITDGQVTVKWTPPFDINTSQFPPPYSYEVYRAEGFSGEINIANAHPGRVSDTTFADTGLNTEETIYNYRIVLYDSLGTKIDTSFTASSVRLETKPQIGKIELRWEADVPWNNQTQDYPRHLIYRGPEGATESQLTLIDNVDVNQFRYLYIDSGQFQNTPLEQTKTYCYRVMTRGAYGNPRIEEPLLNFSQIICTQPSDTVPPCQPELNVIGLSCEDIIQNTTCGNTIFSNRLTWNRPTDETCRADVRSYNIYIANKVGEEFVLYKTNVRDTFFIDSNENLKSFARCYKISSVDRSGNESALSESYCFDNCPYYELPNVFTPNGDNCNEVFRAYGDPEQSPDCGGGQDPARCARFVEDVEFVVYNRWGKEVYRMAGGKENSIYIRWNGKDNEGRDLSSGIYYYKATVYFTTVDPANEIRELKGWVHLIRSKTQ